MEAHVVSARQRGGGKKKKQGVVMRREVKTAVEVDAFISKPFRVQAE